MSRPHKSRKITQPPIISGFKPYGGTSRQQKGEVVFMLCEEYESLRLTDYEKCNHSEAAKIMQVSRPTFTRIYISAREKIAKAFVEGKQIIIVGGKIEYDNDWFHCLNCECTFNKLTETTSGNCPLCGGENINPYSESK
ncbi:MAG: DUF134 domain-containing protein [Dysgonomonas sp.]